jgi:hypothetical protein
LISVAKMVTPSSVRQALADVVVREGPPADEASAGPKLPRTAPAAKRNRRRGPRVPRGPGRTPSPRGRGGEASSPLGPNTARFSGVIAVPTLSMLLSQDEGGVGGSSRFPAATRHGRRDCVHPQADDACNPPRPSPQPPPLVIHRFPSPRAMARATSSSFAAAAAGTVISSTAWALIPSWMSRLSASFARPTAFSPTSGASGDKASITGPVSCSTRASACCRSSLCCARDFTAWSRP